MSQVPPLQTYAGSFEISCDSAFEDDECDAGDA